jgi:hypothetical protein
MAISPSEAWQLGSRHPSPPAPPAAGCRAAVAAGDSRQQGRAGRNGTRRTSGAVGDDHGAAAADLVTNEVHELVAPGACAVQRVRRRHAARAGGAAGGCRAGSAALRAAPHPSFLWAGRARSALPVGKGMRTTSLGPCCSQTPSPGRGLVRKPVAEQVECPHAVRRAKRRYVLAPGVAAAGRRAGARAAMKRGPAMTCAWGEAGRSSIPSQCCSRPLRHSIAPPAAAHQFPPKPCTSSTAGPDDDSLLRW